MFLSVACASCNTPPCDGLAACIETHFSSAAEYSACIDAASTALTACLNGCASGTDYEAIYSACLDACTIARDNGLDGCRTAATDCEDGCQDSLMDCEGPLASALEACSTALAACIDEIPSQSDCESGCDSAYSDCVTGCGDDLTCISGCADTRSGCLGACSDAYDAALDSCNSTNSMCVDAANEAWHICTDGNLALLAACVAGCEAGFDGCSQPIIDRWHICNFDCETAREEQPIVDEKAAAECVKGCCQSSDVDDRGKVTISKCVKDLTVIYDDCMLAAVGTSRTCLEECLTISQGNNWDTIDPARDICMAGCQATLEIDTRNCNAAKILSNYECHNKLFGEYECCGFPLNDCYFACEKPFSDGNRDCLNARTGALNDCVVSNIGCTGGSCEATYEACLAAAHAAYVDCQAPFASTRFDCRFACCEGYRLKSAIAAAFKVCWHSSDCQNNTADNDVDCQDALDACLEGQVGYFADGSGHQVAMLVCENCGPEAWQSYNGAPA